MCISPPLKKRWFQFGNIYIYIYIYMEKAGEEANKSFDWFCEQHAKTPAIRLVYRTKHINRISPRLFGGLPFFNRFFLI